MARVSLSQSCVTIVAWLLCTLCTAWIVWGAVAVAITKASGKRAEHALAPPPVSVLKPLCGADVALADNLETFFQQRGVTFELVFGVENASDPALSIVEALREKYPDVAVRVVVHSGGGALNPKVRNLGAMLPVARHDLVLVSDSNVRAPDHYVAEMSHEFGGEKVGLVTNLFSGTGERSLGSALENVQLNGFCAAGAAATTLLGDSSVIGKSMLFSRTEFERLGGFDSVSHVLAEDYVIGKKYQHAGYRVKIAPTVLESVTTGTTVSAFVERQTRWGMLRCRLRPVAFALEPITSPLVLLPLALGAFGAIAWLWAAALLVLRDVFQWLLLAGPARAWIPLVVSPLRELCCLWVWLRAPFRRHVSWRGNRVRLSAGTLVYACPHPE